MKVHCIVPKVVNTYMYASVVLKTRKKSDPTNCEVELLLHSSYNITRNAIRTVNKDATIRSSLRDCIV